MFTNLKLPFLKTRLILMETYKTGMAQLLQSKIKPLVIPMVFIFLIAIVFRFITQKPAVTVKAETDGVGINFNNNEAPLDTNSTWRWTAAITANKHVGETIPIQYGVFWCKTSGGLIGEGKGTPCGADITPDDYLDTLIFENQQLLIQNTSREYTHRGVSCGRIQIDIGGLGGILGGDTFDSGISCVDENIPTPTGQQDNPPTIPREPSNSDGDNQQITAERIFRCIFFADCINNTTSNELPLPEEPEVSGLPNPPTNPNPTFTSLHELFNEIASKVGLPQKILEGVVIIEGGGIQGSLFNATPEQIKEWATPGKEMTPCGNNACSARGVMQLTTGADDKGDPTCPRCAGAKGTCPNAWGAYSAEIKDHTPLVCNLHDNIYAAAVKLKNDSHASSPISWTKDEVYRAAVRYYGSCDSNHKYTRDFGEGKMTGTYCELLWAYYSRWRANAPAR